MFRGPHDELRLHLVHAGIPDMEPVRMVLWDRAMQRHRFTVGLAGRGLGKTLARPWQDLGKTLAGRSLARPWQDLGRSKSWQDLGKTLAKKRMEIVNVRSLAGAVSGPLAWSIVGNFLRVFGRCWIDLWQPPTVAAHGKSERAQEAEKLRLQLPLRGSKRMR